MFRLTFIVLASVGSSFGVEVYAGGYFLAIVDVSACRSAPSNSIGLRMSGVGGIESDAVPMRVADALKLIPQIRRCCSSFRLVLLVFGTSVSYSSAAIALSDRGFRCSPFVAVLSL